MTIHDKEETNNVIYVIDVNSGSINGDLEKPEPTQICVVVIGGSGLDRSVLHAIQAGLSDRSDIIEPVIDEKLLEDFKGYGRSNQVELLNKIMQIEFPEKINLARSYPVKNKLKKKKNLGNNHRRSFNSKNNFGNKKPGFNFRRNK
jgi:hypothetical protein